MRDCAGWWVFITEAPELEWDPPKQPNTDEEKAGFGKGMRGFTDEES